MSLSGEDKLLLQEFFSGVPVKRAYLFGSIARGQDNSQSDIDILVELDHTKPIGMKFFLIKSDLEDLLNRKVDLVTTEGLPDYIKPNIDKDKILIYERINH